LLIMFGWLKETKEVGPALDCYCYRCQRQRSWEHWKETEWVTFFTIKTIPFLSKTRIVCGGCREPVQLDRERANFLTSKEHLPRLVNFLEEHQLAQKSPIQRNYLKAQREQHEL